MFRKMKKFFVKLILRKRNYSGNKSSPISSSSNSSSLFLSRFPAEVLGLSGAGPKGSEYVESISFSFGLNSCSSSSSKKFADLNPK